MWTNKIKDPNQSQWSTPEKSQLIHVLTFQSGVGIQYQNGDGMISRITHQEQWSTKQKQV